MENSENEMSRKGLISKDLNKKNDTGEDEINLMVFFRIIYNHKGFILLGSVLPALLVGLVLFIIPKDYKVTYTYDVGQDEKDYNMLLGELHGEENLDNLTARLENDKLSEKDGTILIERFYGAANLNKLAEQLSTNGYDEYAQGISRTKVRLEISDALLNITIAGRDQEDLQGISSFVRDNFETLLSMYFALKILNNDILWFKLKTADIEEQKFNLELELDRKKAILQKLKAMASADSNNIPQGIVLHIDNVRGSSEILPWAYQVQVADANIIYLEETIRTNQKRYDHYKALLSLNENLFDEIKNNAPSYNTTEEFYTFLTDTLGNYQSTEVNDYINAYTHNIENVISNNTALVENPRINPIPRGTIKKSMVVFAALFMITIIITFFLEAARKS
jgi:hypothetical protein